MAVPIRRATLAQQVEAGWKRKQLAEHYGLPEAQIARVLKEAGLQIRKFHAPKYQLVDDDEETVVEESVEDLLVAVDPTLGGNDETVGEDIRVLHEESTKTEEAVVDPSISTTKGW